MMRLRIGKVCRSGSTSIENSETIAPFPLRIFSASADHRDRAALRRQRALVRGSVDAARETADDGETGIRQLVGKLLRRLAAVMSGAPRTNHSNRVLIPLRQFSPDIQHDRRSMNLPELPRIERRLSRDDFRAKVPNALQLSRKVNLALPARNLLRHLSADSIHCAQSSTTSSKNPFRCLERLQQLAQPHRSHSGHHIQRDAGFRGVHRLSQE
jgi:hypothetical protein